MPVLEAIGGGGIYAFMKRGGKPVVTGGSFLETSTHYYHYFYTNSTFTVSSGSLNVDYLVVGGGGAGDGGGGGAGGYLSVTNVTLNPTDYPVVVGLGGLNPGLTGAGNDGATNGGNSSFNGSIAIGGGAGGYQNAGKSGGSGGGGGNFSDAGGGFTSGQGAAGGAAYNGVSASGGGGGAGATGGNAPNSNTGGNGGAGATWLDGKVYAAGGGGGAATTGGSGGSGIGGSGAVSGNYEYQNGVSGTGSGGGGIYQSYPGGNGGSGVVAIRYLKDAVVTPEVATSFDPRDLSGLMMWYDAADASTLSVSGGTVLAWADKSGNQRHAFQGDPTRRPTYVSSGLNLSKPYVDFDNVSNDRMTIYNGPLFSGRSNHIFAVVATRYADPTDMAGIIGRYDPVPSNTSGSFSYTFPGGGTAGGAQIYLNPQVAWFVGGTKTDYTINTFYQINAKWGSETVTYRQSRVDDGGGSTSGTGAVTKAVNALGWQEGTTYGGTIRIAELLVFSAPLSNADRNTVEDYLFAKWGV